MERYAVYFSPRPETGLASFGAGWLGWDAEHGVTVSRVVETVFDKDTVDRFTAAPRRYGFHGTLKPPFRLAEGKSFEDLHAAVSALAVDLSPIDMGLFQLKRIGRFLAIVPVEQREDLRELAARCVTELDEFRAPAPPTEIERRRKVGLSPHQDALLAKWGYPYVLDAFRFHLTLTSSLEARDLDRAEDSASTMLKPILGQSVFLSDLCLFGDPGGNQPFRLVERIPLGGGER